MLNFAAERKQTDGKGDDYSFIAGTDNPDPDSGARQEMRDESDVNTILKRFGVMAPQKRVFYGTADMDADLQYAMTAIEEAQRIHADMPQDLRVKYPTWQAMLDAIASGELAIGTKPEEPKTDVTPAAPTT